LGATLDKDLRHQFANRGYLQWLGKEAAQVLGHTVQDVYGDAAGVVVASIRRAFAGQPQRQQIALADGRLLDAHFEPRFAADGPVDGVYLLAQDAGWQTAHERSLAALLAAAFDPTVVLDFAGVIVRLNDKVETLFGAPRDTLLGQRLAALLEAPADTALTEALAQVRDKRQPQHLTRGLELHARRADGKTVPVTLHLAPMEGGRGVQAVVAIHDLGPRLAWEQLMIGSRGKAEVTLDAISDAVVACDLQERITLFNPAAVRVSGWTEDEALGKSIGEVLRFVEPDDDAVLASSLARDAVRRNAVVRQQNDRLLLRSDGERVAVAESAAPIRDRFGHPAGAVLLLHDVSRLHAQTQTLAHQAQHDDLTGLPNRVLLQDRLSQALAQLDRGYKGALLYVDLDHFKPINDTHGHPVGDRVLQEIATRLRGGVREDDTVSRQGGDEFVLLLVRLADPRDAARVAEKLIAAVEQPIHVDGHELVVSASIGIALFPQDGRDSRTLTKQADAALYHAKQAGRGRYSYFTDVMSASAEERVRTEHDLRIALSNNDFLLAWQPQVTVPQRLIAGVEALVRWRQSDGVIAAPESFIAVAEETGLITQIDEWVLHEACRQNCRWQAQGLPPLPVSVNVSLARFDGDRLLAHVRAVLLDTGMDPRWLEIEFKGAQLFAEGARGQALVAGLKVIGVRVAADDFGSGQPSLGALSQFAFDTLKVDRDFVSTITDDAASRAVVVAMLGIAGAMGYRVVAKGVETQAQHDTLVELGCTGMQGLMFGQAASAVRFAVLAEQGVVEQGADTA
jgi:diguanylate cyclase (GGDEF)-like protein/PAS domain S-box-containing protein